MPSALRRVVFVFLGSTKRSVAAATLGVALALAAVSADAALVVETRTDTNDIQVPRFNPALGTLQSVTLDVTMQSGVSAPSGAHDHTDKVVVSNNSVSSDSYEPFTPFTIGTSSPAGNHNHPFSTPFYGGGGVVIGSFAGTTVASGSHNHQLTISFDGFQPSGLDERLRVRIGSSASPDFHEHNVSSAIKSLSFTGGGVTPFEGLSDLVIPAGSFTFNAAGNHTHSYAPFSVMLDEDSPFGGTDTFHFSGGQLNSIGFHNHAFDPRFSVTATFEYAAIPEPSLAGVFLIGAAAFACRRSGWSA